MANPKYDPVGEIRLLGKAVKIVLDPNSDDPVYFFCFADDLLKLFRNEYQYVRMFRDNLKS